MSRLAELIEQLCPDGVEYRALGDVGVFVRGGGLQKADFVETGMPCVHYGQIHTRFGISVSEAVTFVSEAQFARLKHADYGDLLIATTSEDDEAVGKATAWLGDGEVAISGDMFYYRHNLDPKYVSYFFASSSFQDQKRPYLTGAKVRRIADKGLSRIQIPVPPPEVQREIARILDQFTTLEAELEAELEARRSQYEHYRNHLLSYESLAARGPVNVIELQDVGVVRMCKRIHKAETSVQGDIPFFKISTFGGTPTSFISVELYEKYKEKYPYPKQGDLLISAAGTIGQIVRFDGADAYFQDSNIVWLEHDESIVLNRYLYYVYLNTRWTTDGGTIKRLYNNRILQQQICVPPIETQIAIADLLDRFDALVNDITSGLPAEIAARRAQYEHYRDRLLSFPEKVVSVSDAS